MLVQDIKDWKEIFNGQTNWIYEATYNGKKVCIKLYKNIKLYNHELKTCKILSGSPNFPILIGKIVTDSNYYLVFEWIENIDTLENFLQNNNQIFDRKKFIDKLLYILNSLHNKGIYHGDFKAKNILVVNKNAPKLALIDFDYSRKLTKKNRKKEYIRLLLIILQVYQNKEYSEICNMDLKDILKEISRINDNEFLKNVIIYLQVNK